MNEARRRKISYFLLHFKRLAVQSGIYVVPRVKNQKALADLELTRKNRTDIILSLSVTDYCRGPEPDRDKPGFVWEFGKIVEGRPIYIKLKIAETDGGQIARCISFHAAEFPLSFPCGTEEE